MTITNPLKQLLIFSVLFLLTDTTYGLCVKTEKANLRKGPGTSYEVSWLTFKYMPLVKIAQKGKWFKVRDFENDTHWVHKSVVTDKFKCAVVKQKVANLRTGPGTKFKPAADTPKAERTMTYKYVKSKGRWAKIKDHWDDPYWVYRNLVWIN